MLSAFWIWITGCCVYWSLHSCHLGQIKATSVIFLYWNLLHLYCEGGDRGFLRNPGHCITPKNTILFIGNVKRSQNHAKPKLILFLQFRDHFAAKIYKWNWLFTLDSTRVLASECNFLWKYWFLEELFYWLRFLYREIGRQNQVRWDGIYCLSVCRNGNGIRLQLINKITKSVGNCTRNLNCVSSGWLIRHRCCQ
jgi:hypothetical protein